MAITFNDIKSGPQTHVLIIGVGHYPYLPGGAQEKPQTFALAKGLGQLDSTVISANAFYDEVMALGLSGSWISPLGSVELLTDGVEEATRANVERAYWEWKERCNSHEENVAVFYYAGHGFGMPQEQYLVLSDFGKLPANPWNACLSFSATRMAFHACKAKTQLFFVDACRSVTADVLRNTIVVPSVDIIDNLQSECIHNLTVLGSAANESAFGIKGGTSYFLEAILSGLRGFGAENGADCIISTADFPPNINNWLSLAQRKDSSAQRCTATINKPGNFIKLPKHPDAELELDCNPADAVPLASFTYMGAAGSQTRAPEIAPWKVKIPAGIYQMSVNFSVPHYQNKTDFKKVAAPGIKQVFNVKVEL